MSFDIFNDLISNFQDPRNVLQMCHTTVKAMILGFMDCLIIGVIFPHHKVSDSYDN